MPARLYHSPSSISTILLCQYRGARQYFDGMREPDTAATEFGGEFHAVAEAYFRGEKVDWTTSEAKLFLKGIHLTPKPGVGFVGKPKIEGCLGMGRGGAPMPPEAHEHAPPRRWRQTGGRIWWAGKIDLEYWPARAEVKRLGLPSLEVITQDWKTCADIKRYALTDDDGPRPLRDDLQACLYSLEKMERLGLRESWVRWVYFPKKGGSPVPVLTCISYEHAKKIVDAAEQVALAFDALSDSDAAEKNPDACYAYGRVCIHHRSKGGPCAALAQLKTDWSKVKMTAGKGTSRLAALRKLTEQKAAAAKGGAEAAAEEVATEGGDEWDQSAAAHEAEKAEEVTVVAETTAEAPPAKSGPGNRKPRATKAAKAPRASSGSLVATMTKLTAKLEKAEEKVEAAREKVATAETERDTVLDEIALAAKGGA